MIVGVPRETAPGERRVALIPETAEKLAKSGVGVMVERGAGDRAFHADDAYAKAGATIAADARELYSKGDLILHARRPAADSLEMLRDGIVIVAPLQPLSNPDVVRRLAQRRVTAFSTDAIPRIARAQALDVLSSMASIAGYAAALTAARSLPKFFPLLMTAAGTLTPARVFVIGAGVAGLQAIATARRLGAVVEAFDTRPVVKEQVQSLGATFVEAALGAAETEDKGGYAKELSEDAHRRELELVAGRAREADVVITTALIPGKRAPLLITADTVRAMRPGSVIVDLAGEQGGNCELSRPGETVVEHGVTIHAPLDLVSSMPVHASQMLSRNHAALLQLLIKDGTLTLNFEDEIIREACITHDGKVVPERVRAIVDGSST
ncbi:MAG TPA: Re/Si-specific NAD(P)(+) transhydrogenase subunit alpha [Gemmatimonadaceae bacterium]|nr:Re/Si-specific NAD(P)(+) transhydrogenase subunit alpha [Gemmatimonadaceae bacterium]